METSDLIAIGILLFFVILGLLGSFKWLVQLFVGLLVGLLVLVFVSVVAENPKFDFLSRGIFKQGVIVPFIRKQVDPVHDLFGDSGKLSVGKKIVSADVSGENELTTKDVRESFAKPSHE